MRIQELAGKRICILGFGREGQATLRALRTYAPGAEITVADGNSTTATEGCTLRVGPTYMDDLGGFDWIIKSPGIPPNAKLTQHAKHITSATQIFIDTVQAAGATVIGITGSKGKSTTTTLIYELLKAAKKNVYLVGNIGIPALDYLEHAGVNTIFVQEMSSYQLMDLTTSPQVAVITAFFPEHLDYHGSLAAYQEAKAHIARFQNSNNVVFYSDSFAQTKAMALESKGTKIPYSKADAPVTLGDIQLKGEHNLMNIGGAWKVAQHFGVPLGTALPVIKAFKGLPHRLQSLGMHHGIEWIDDAISTTPESAIAAINALGEKVTTIILGGQDRGYDFAALAKRIAASKVRTVILFPGSGPRIREAIGDARAEVCFHEADSMAKAVSLARKHTMEGTICLLSTASPSYGMFKNFEDKGEQFQMQIHKQV
jgi:UDP-N-acetylmuramoylalanine--D-glutamate ligase